MNPKIKKRWIEALRSKKYKQGREYLKQIDSKGDLRYCCLGVLCEVIKNHKFIKQQGIKFELSDDDFLFDQDRSELSSDVLNYIDLHDNLQSLLMNMNDVKRKNFSQIASYIEKNL